MLQNENQRYTDVKVPFASQVFFNLENVNK